MIIEFFPAATTAAKPVFSSPRALQFAFPGSGDPDDWDRLRRQYQLANGEPPDQGDQDPELEAFATALCAHVKAILGPRSASASSPAQNAQQQHYYQGTRSTPETARENMVRLLKAKTRALAATRRVTRPGLG